MWRFAESSCVCLCSCVLEEVWFWMVIFMEGGIICFQCKLANVRISQIIYCTWLQTCFFLFVFFKRFFVLVFSPYWRFFAASGTAYNTLDHWGPKYLNPVKRLFYESLHQGTIQIKTIMTKSLRIFIESQQCSTPLNNINDNMNILLISIVFNFYYFKLMTDNLFFPRKPNGVTYGAMSKLLIFIIWELMVTTSHKQVFSRWGFHKQHLYGFWIF